MLTKLEINGIKIESDEGIEKVFSMLKNIKDFNLENTGKENIKNNDGDYDVLKNEINNKNKHISALEKSISSLNSDVKSLKDENQKLNTGNKELIEEKEKYKSEIQSLKNEIDRLNKNISEIKNSKPTIIETPKEEPKVVKEEKEEPKQEIKNNNVDFNPNNANDIEWLKGALKEVSNTDKPNIEIPKQELSTPKTTLNIPDELKENTEKIENGMKIIKNEAGEIIQINEFVLTLHEKTLLKVNLTTPEKILSNRKMMQESDKIIAHGWE